tara:strand:+ start:317 stop:859 length:543 start_codon:yes stop_codon:yes gene_type:complete
MSSILKVDTIQNTGGTTGLTIDSSGRVLTSVRPAFMVGISSQYSHTSGNVIQYDTTSGTGGFNSGNHFDTSNYKFVVPVDGLYQFHASLMIGPTGEYSRSVNVRLNINNSQLDARYGARTNMDGDRTGGSSYMGLRGLWLVNLTAAQEITWKASWETDGTLDASENLHLHGAYCWGMLVG